MLIQYAPWLIAMSVLIFCSAFFSSSEAAFFYLPLADRRRMAAGNRAQRIAAAMLDDPDRLLTAVLFWNLISNLAYFTIVSITSIQLNRNGHITTAVVFAAVALLVMIVLGEMLPKSLAVLKPRSMAATAAIPLAAMVRALDPALPALRTAKVLSQRLFFPRFHPEPYLRVGDLERAVELSTSDASLLDQEQRVLQNIVLLSEIRADELMRPRIRFMSFRPPVSLADLQGRVPPSGYLLVTEPDSDEGGSGNHTAEPVERTDRTPRALRRAGRLCAMVHYGRPIARDRCSGKADTWPQWSTSSVRRSASSRSTIFSIRYSAALPAVANGCCNASRSDRCRPRCGTLPA